MTDIVRIVTADGQVHAWHGSVEALPAAHPGARITHRQRMDTIGQGTWEPYAAATPQATPEPPATPAAPVDTVAGSAAAAKPARSRRKGAA